MAAWTRDDWFGREAGMLSRAQWLAGGGLLLALVLALHLPLFQAPAHWRDQALRTPAEPPATAPLRVGVDPFPESVRVGPPLSRRLLTLPGLRQSAGRSRALACLFHGCAAVLLWLLLRRLHLPGAYLGALLFALHPAGVTAVGWLTRHESVFGLPLALLSLLAWTGFLRGTPRRWAWYAFMLAALLLALLATAQALVVPLLCVAILWWRRSDPDRRGGSRASRGATPAADAAPEPAAVPAPAAAAGHRRHHHRRDWRHNAVAAITALFAVVRLPQNWVLKNLVRLVPAFLLAGALVPAHLHWARRTVQELPTFMLFADAVSAPAALGWCWLAALGRLFVPLAGPFLAPLHAGGTFGGNRLLPLLALAGLLLALAVARRLRPARALLLFTLASVLPLASTVFVTPPLSATAFFTADAAFYWVLPAVAALTAGVCAALAARLSGALALLPAAAAAGLLAAEVVLGAPRLAVLSAPRLPWAELQTAHPATAWIAAEVGTGLLRQGRLDAAATQFEHTLEIMPGYPPALDGLGRVLLQQGNSYLAQSRFEQAVAQTPQDPNLRLRLALACEAWGLHDKAIAQYREAVRLRPDSRFALRQLGLAQVRGSRVLDAMRTFEELVGRDPADEDNRLQLATLHILQGNFATARALLDATLKENPGSAHARLLLGYTFYQERREPEARAAFTALLEAHPDAASARVLLFFLCLDNELFDEAATHCLAALRARPRSPQLLAVVSQIRANYPRFSLPDPEHSTVALAEKACRLTSYGDAALLQTLALAYAEEGRTREALDTFDKAAAFAEGRGYFALLTQIRTLRRQVAAGETLPDRDSIMLGVPDIVQLLDL